MGCTCLAAIVTFIDLFAIVLMLFGGWNLYRSECKRRHIVSFDWAINLVLAGILLWIICLFVGDPT